MCRLNKSVFPGLFAVTGGGDVRGNETPAQKRPLPPAAVKERNKNVFTEPEQYESVSL